MTPLALKIVRRLLAGPRTAEVLEGLKKFERAKCFDLTPVASLLNPTMDTLRGRQSSGDIKDVLTASEPLIGEHTRRMCVEHGGLLFCPAPTTWVEYDMKDLYPEAAGRGVRLGFFAEDEESRILFTLNIWNSRRAASQGFLYLDPDGEHFFIGAYVYPETDAHLVDADSNCDAAFHVAAALLIINAPYGVKRVTSPPHKEVQREARRAGTGAFQPVHTIYLDKSARAPGDGSGERGAPKAFHFCRSHLRHLASGATTRIRAHWRGDPSLGIVQSNYKVTG